MDEELRDKLTIRVGVLHKSTPCEAITARLVVDTILPVIQQEIAKAPKDPFDYVQPCEPDCSPERHAYHQGQWDMAHRMIDKELTLKELEAEL